MIRISGAFGALALLAVATAGTGWAEPVLPVAAAPQGVGLSSSQLARIEEVTQRHIETGLWTGNAGTLFWIDPKEQLIAIYLVQVNDADRVMLRNQFRTMVQSAIIN
jgi:CubicO group peptidase (beta-lactamase class C family)